MFHTRAERGQVVPATSGGGRPTRLSLFRDSNYFTACHKGLFIDCCAAHRAIRSILTTFRARICCSCSRVRASLFTTTLTEPPDSPSSFCSLSPLLASFSPHFAPASCRVRDTLVNIFILVCAPPYATTFRNTSGYGNGPTGVSSQYWWRRPSAALCVGRVQLTRREHKLRETAQSRMRGLNPNPMLNNYVEPVATQANAYDSRRSHDGNTGL